VHRQVEHAINAITVFGAVTARLRLDVIDILGIELRPDIRRNVGVGHGHAVNRPGYLVAAAHVQLIVHHVRSGHEIGDDFEAVAGINTGIRGDLPLVDKEVASWRLGIQVGGRCRHVDTFVRRCKRKLVVQHRRAARAEHQHLCGCGEAWRIDRDAVFSYRHGRELEDAVGIRGAHQRVS